VSAATTQLTLGQNQQFTAIGTLTDKTTQDLTQTAAWSSSSNLLLLMDNKARKGTAYPRGTGQASVTATSGNIRGSAQVSIVSLLPRYSYVSNNTDNTISAFVIDPQTGKTRSIGYVLAGGPLFSPFGIAIDPQQRFLYTVSNFQPGVAAFTIDAASGRLAPVAGSPFAATTFQRIAKVHPNGKFLYVSDQGGGTVSAFAINQTTGAITPIAGSPFSAQTQVSGLDIEPFGRFLYTANQDGSISEFSVDGASGTLVPLAGSPLTGAMFPVSVSVDPTARFAYVANFGSNSVSAFSIDAASGKLAEIPGSPFATGSAPASVTVHPSGRFVYVAHSAGITAYTSDDNSGALTEVGAISAGPDATTIAADPSGSFLYVASVASQTTHTYAVNSATGALTLVENSNARHAPIFLALTGGNAAVTTRPKFVYQANFGSSDVSAFSVDPVTGALAGVAGSPFSIGGSPASVAASPDGRFVFVADFTGNRLAALAADANGVLTPIAGSPFATPSSPRAVWVDPSGLYLYVVHQSALDNLSMFNIDQSTGALTLIAGSPLTAGSAPESVTMTPAGKYLVTGNTASSDLTVVRSSGTGGLEGVVGSPFASPFFVQDLAFDPTGKFLYAPIASSFKGSSTVVAGYMQDGLTGALTPLTGSPFNSGDNPVAAVADPTGRFLYVANFSGASIGMFSIDALTGVPTPLGAGTISTPGSSSPISLAVDGSGKFLFVALQGPVTTAVFKIDQNSGTLSPASTATAGNTAFGIAVVEERK
jgi:6-phosphogluconolactonase (cycloisomerase 2 family)